MFVYGNIKMYLMSFCCAQLANKTDESNKEMEKKTEEKEHSEKTGEKEDSERTKEIKSKEHSWGSWILALFRSSL